MRAMVRPLAALTAVALTLGGAGRARAQDTYFQSGSSDSFTFKVDRERTTQQRVLIASLFGGTVLFGAIGVAFHIDSKNKSDEVSTTSGHLSGRIYTHELEDTRQAAVRSRNLTIASYAIGGGFLVGTFIAYLLTDPGQETVHVGTEAATARLRIEPTDGGALVGGVWSF
jgi:hypothetical protein